MVVLSNYCRVNVTAGKTVTRQQFTRSRYSITTRDEKMNEGHARSNTASSCYAMAALPAFCLLRENGCTRYSAQRTNVLMFLAHTAVPPSLRSTSTIVAKYRPRRLCRRRPPTAHPAAVFAAFPPLFVLPPIVTQYTARAWFPFLLQPSSSMNPRRKAGSSCPPCSE